MIHCLVLVEPFGGGESGCVQMEMRLILRLRLNYCKFTASKGIALALLLYVH
jgi:hypothetical protein